MPTDPGERGHSTADTPDRQDGGPGRLYPRESQFLWRGRVLALCVPIIGGTHGQAMEVTTVRIR